MLGMIEIPQDQRINGSTEADILISGQYPMVMQSMHQKDINN